jgi:hypothetical protein
MRDLHTLAVAIVLIADISHRPGSDSKCALITWSVIKVRPIVAIIAHNAKFPGRAISSRVGLAGERPMLTILALSRQRMVEGCGDLTVEDGMEALAGALCAARIANGKQKKNSALIT